MNFREHLDVGQQMPTAAMMEEIIKALQDDPAPEMVAQLYHVVHPSAEIPFGFTRRRGPRAPVHAADPESIIGSLADDPDFSEMMRSIVDTRADRYASQP